MARFASISACASSSWSIAFMAAFSAVSCSGVRASIANRSRASFFALAIAALPSISA